MSSYSVTEARIHLSRLINRAMEGEAIVITRRGRPVVEIKPLAQTLGPMSKPDVERLMKGRVNPRTTGWNSADLVRRMRDDGV